MSVFLHFILPFTNQTDDFNSIHFSSLVLQPWSRNLNYNPKYEDRRNYVQVKWYRLEELTEKILNKNNKTKED